MYICLTEKYLKSRIKLTGHRSDHEKLFLVSFTLLAIRYLLVNILSLVPTKSPASASLLRWTMKRQRAGSELVAALTSTSREKREHTINTLTTDTSRFYDEDEIFSILNQCSSVNQRHFGGKN